MTEWLRLPVSRCAPGPHGAVGGWAALNVLTGEKWYQGVGLAGLTAMGTLWARAGWSPR